MNLSLKYQIGEDELSLTIGGIKAFNQDNLYSTKSTLEQFKVFIGFQNKVCTNLCIATDGLNAAMKANSAAMLQQQAKELFYSYVAENSIQQFQQMREIVLSESEFAHLLGRAKLYNAMHATQRKHLPELGLTDSQLTTVAEDYYQDTFHSRNDDGSINLWAMYNLFTGANKSSYIDTILDRNVSIYNGVKTLSEAIVDKQAGT